MILSLISFLWLIFISLIYMDFSPLIVGLSLRGAAFLLTPELMFLGLLAGQAGLVGGLWWRRRRHGYNVPLYVAALGFLGSLLGSQFSPPLLSVAVLFQGLAIHLDLKTSKQAIGGKSSSV